MDNSPRAVGKGVAVVQPIIADDSSWKTRFHMLFYGVSCVLFWSVFIMQLPFVAPYFGGIKVMFYVSMVYGLSSNISRVVLMFMHNRSGSKLSLRIDRLVYLGASVTALGMFLFPICMGVLSTSHPDISFWICLGITAMVGAFNSLLVTGGFALMSLAPPVSGQFFLIGFTLTGIITWPFIVSLRLISEAAGTSGDTTTLIVSIISLSITGILCLMSIPMYRFKTSKNPYFISQLARDSVTPCNSRNGIIPVFRKIWPIILSLWSSRVITFALYPGLIGLWSPHGQVPFSKNLYQSFLLYLGPVSDTIGQFAFRFTPLSAKLGERALTILTIVRGLVLIPLFIQSAKFDETNSILAQDWFRILLMFFFSFSMGINYSLGNAIAPTKFDSPDDKYTVGVILSFVAMNGLFVGSLVGIGFKEILA